MFSTSFMHFWRRKSNLYALKPGLLGFRRRMREVGHLLDEEEARGDTPRVLRGGARHQTPDLVA